MAEQSEGKGHSPAWIELLKALPGLLWVLFAAFAFCSLLEPALDLIRKHEIGKIAVASFVVELTQPKNNAIMAVRDSKVFFTNNQIATLFEPINRRFNIIAEQVIGANILWIDDKHPVQNKFERRVLGAYGIKIDMAKSTREGLDLIDDFAKADSGYDIVIENMDRQNDEKAQCYAGVETKFPYAGCDFAKQLADRGKNTPVLIYRGEYKPGHGTPGFVFGVTNRVDHLVHFVFDILERKPATDAHSCQDATGATPHSAHACP
ncbi:hypothetical protein [Methylocystis sp. SC2]|uniref:hypothetical protein n=1 Tax=Methylocystis sp. (strain SC2) TaxID=187303 RepID=UPI00027AE6EE|nr:hypothetical protein [Methylocystis sp. SC2]CCJ05508.1 Response regulator receiver protein [Methylocystis sp. SC2]